MAETTPDNDRASTPLEAARIALGEMRGGYEANPEGKATVNGPVRPSARSPAALRSAAANSRRSLNKLKK